MNMAIMTIYIALFCILSLQLFITGLHKMETEGRKVNMGSLMNSTKDIAAFHKLISATSWCHAIATA